jgi:methylmalonyl-CoA mutase cobalamin-binding subunit
MEGDHHDLGAQAIRVLLERQGWKVYYLGADVPVEEFAQIQRAQGASLVCISVSPENAIPDVQRIIRVLGEFYRPGYPYALGLGGVIGAVSGESIPEGPFLSQSISSTARDFIAWVESLAEDENQDSKVPRRAA